jgi:haloalkane dehalogenase
LPRAERRHHERGRARTSRWSTASASAAAPRGRQDEVFEPHVFATRFKALLPHAEGPHLVTGRHFLQEDSGPEIAALIVDFLRRLARAGAGA